MSLVRRGLAAIALVSAVFVGVGVDGAHALTTKAKTEAADPCSDRFAWKAGSLCVN